MPFSSILFTSVTPTTTGEIKPTWWIQPTQEWRLWRSIESSPQEKGPWRRLAYLHCRSLNQWLPSPIWVLWDEQFAPCPSLSCPDLRIGYWVWTPCFSFPQEKEEIDALWVL